MGECLSSDMMFSWFRKIGLIVLLLFLVVWGLCFFFGVQFSQGFEDGQWSAFHDCTANEDMPCTNFEGYVYWDEKTFWYQQGYEEGYKNEAKRLSERLSGKKWLEKAKKDLLEIQNLRRRSN